MLELIVFIGSIVGIALLVALNAWLGLWRPARLESVEAAIERIDIDAVGFEAGEGVLADDGQAALVEDRNADRIALIQTRADRYVIRYLTPGSLRDVEAGEDGLYLALRDFSLPRAVVRLHDRAMTGRWRDRLDAFKAQA